MKKAMSPFISLVLVVSISIAGIVLVLRMGGPLLEKTEDFSRFSESKEFLNQLNSAVKDVSYEGNGSSRIVTFVSSGGVYRVSSLYDTVTYEMTSKYDLFSENLSKKEGDINIKFQNKTLLMSLNYTKMDIIEDERWSSGQYSIMVKNNGYYQNKTMIDIFVI